MPSPARWSDDPDCGHAVTCAHQTHYCTYIRAPRLLALQQPATPDHLLLITAYQWYELWFKVLRLDLQAALASDCQTYEPVKLLKRGLELFRLFDLHADMAEMMLVRELGVCQALSDLPRGAGAPSAQLAEIAALARGLPRLARSAGPGAPGLAEAAGEYAARLKQFRRRFGQFARATLRPAGAPAPSYAEWLRLPELLSLQDGVKADWCEAGRQPEAFWRPERISADENMFIIVHQCFEVWFKVILALVDAAIPALLRGDIASATRLLRRATAVQRLLVPQIQMPATMLPQDFLLFREQEVEREGRRLHTGLSPASGTESYQFREIEIVCGLRDDAVFQKYLAGSDQLPIRLLTPRQRERLEQPSLPEAFAHAARARGVERYDELFTPASVPNPHLDLALLADTLLDFDEFFRFWRLGHVSMVEKMIGTKSGTGFLGPEYLAETAGLRLQPKNRIFDEPQVRPRFFEALWAVRSRMRVN